MCYLICAGGFIVAYFIFKSEAYKKFLPWGLSKKDCRRLARKQLATNMFNPVFKCFYTCSIINVVLVTIGLTCVTCACAGTPYAVEFGLWVLILYVVAIDIGFLFGAFLSLLITPIIGWNNSKRINNIDPDNAKTMQLTPISKFTNDPKFYLHVFFNNALDVLSFNNRALRNLFKINFDNLEGEYGHYQHEYKGLTRGVDVFTFGVEHNIKNPVIVTSQKKYNNPTLVNIHKMETENTIFNKEFDTYAIEDENLFYVFQPQHYERFIEFKKYYSDFVVCIDKTFMIIALPDYNIQDYKKFSDIEDTFSYIVNFAASLRM